MDLLDLIILILVVASAVHGLRVGAITQITSLIGFIGGLALGALLVVVVDKHIGSGYGKVLVALVLLIVPASLFGGTGRQIGVRISRALENVSFGRIDQVFGSLIAVGGTLVICWLFASILVNSSSPTIAKAIEGSGVLRRVSQILPPVPNAFSSVQRYLSSTGFPQVLANILPESIAPVTVANRAELTQAISIGRSSTVKIIAIGCAEEEEGSGYVGKDGLVVTNAHVIAGTSSISVISPNGATLHAIPVLFDKNFDLAILRVPGLDLPQLQTDDDFVGRGNPAVVLGYPGDGPFNAQPAGVVSRFVALGRDIYDESLTTRVVYELEADVRPGNSGGPLVGSNGEVLGVVFSRSASLPDVGYALASPGIVSRLDAAAKATQSTSTGACTS